LNFFAKVRKNPFQPSKKQFFTKKIGINIKYIYGIKTPSEKRKKEIETGLH